MDTVTINRAIGRSTWYFVDEFHLLLKEEQTAAYSAEIWKRFRKWGGIPTGATQNPKDLLSSRNRKHSGKQRLHLYAQPAAGDRKILAERLNISSEQLAYVTNSEPGHGLLFFNNVILPFVDDFPKDTELYKLLTTKPSEVNTRKGWDKDNGTGKAVCHREKTYEAHIDEEVHLYGLLHQLAFLAGKIKDRRDMENLIDTARRYGDIADQMFDRWSIPGRYLVFGDKADLARLKALELCELDAFYVDCEDDEDQPHA